MNPNIIAVTIIAIGMAIHAYAPNPIRLAIGDGFLVGMSYPISNTHAACGVRGCVRWQLDTTGNTVRMDSMSSTVNEWN